MLNRFVLTAILGLSLTSLSTACRDDSGDDGAGTPDSGPGVVFDAAPGASTTIYDVQSETTPVGSSVSLRNVIVTGIDTFGDSRGSIYVQEEAGGAFSGVLVFVPAGTSAALAVGDIVNVDGGVKDEFALNADTTGRTLTEVSPADGGTITITKVGDGTVPVPEVVSAAALGADDAEAEKWEGVLITLEGVRALGDARVVSDDQTLKEMNITGPYRVGGSLTDLTGVRDDCYASITGVNDYFFNYKILPRSASDIVLDATGNACLPPEDTLATCSDEIDNDQDGFTDCLDFSCQQAEDVTETCTVDTTVVEAQGGTIPENSLIRLTDVVVTAVSQNNTSFWVQDSTGAAALNGLFVFRRGTDGVLPASIVVGRTVTLLGNLDEFNGTLTELTNVEILDDTGAIVTPAVLDGIAIADLASDAQYEGVLVSIAAATVATGTDPACTVDSNFSKFTLVNGASPLQANETIACHPVTAAQCYGTFTGVMHFDSFDPPDDGVDEPTGIVVLPTAGGLTLGGGACP